MIFFQRFTLFIVLIFSSVLLKAQGSPLDVEIIESTDVLCNGDENGTAFAQASGGTPPYDYEWDDPNNQTTAFATGLPAGTWTITVTDAMGNTATASVTINEPDPLEITMSSVDATDCASCDGEATASATGGTPGYTYQWDDPNNQTTETATNLCPGTYTVTVTDANLCVESETVTIESDAGSGITLTTTKIDVSECGACDGEATVEATGGDEPYSYQWNDPLNQTTQTATNLCEGSYSVTVTDDTGCQESITVTIDNAGGSGLTLTMDAVNVSACGECDGEASVTVDGGFGPYTYSWDDPDNQTTQTAIGLCVGTYTVEVTDVNGCTETGTVSVGSDGESNMTLDFDSVDESACGMCDGEATVNVTDGDSPFNYEWDDPDNQTTQTATGLCEGTYSVIVTDANGCQESSSVTINNVGGSGITLTTTTVDESACGLCDGEATVDVVGGTEPYSYQWDDSNNQTTATATDLCEGTYTVIVTDDNGCEESISVTINNVAGSGITLTTTTVDVSACGLCDGEATVDVDGGTEPYSYQWDDSNNQTTATATDLCEGTYTVIVTDDNGCEESISVTIDNAGGSGMTLTIDAVNVTACGECDGEATVNVAGGTEPYDYQWNDPNNQITATATNLCEGTYTVLVTDANGCEETASVSVGSDVESGMTLTTTTVDESACAMCDGEAAVSVDGGTDPYTYEWDDPNNQTTATATGLCEGTYNVTVTDANQCQETTSVTIENAGESGMTLNTTSVDISACGECDGEAAVAVDGGTDPYTYQWDDPDNQTTATATGLCEGTYTVTVIDDNGCEESATATVGSSTASGISLTFNTTNATCGDTDGSATVEPTGGAEPYSYQWDDPANQTTQTAENLAPGTYMVTVTDDNGCSEQGSVNVGETTPPSVTVTTENVSCAGGNDGMATANVTDGNGPYTYQWDDPDNQTTETAINLSAGVYEVMITDADGCQASATGEVMEPDAMNLTSASIDPSCAGSCDGEASVAVTGGEEPYSYQWDDDAFQTTQTATNLCDGTYTVTVTDANGCSQSASVTLIEPDGMTLTTNTIDASCGNADGEASVTVAGGDEPYSYLWDDPNNQTTATATDLAAGGYSVIVTDANNCTATASVSISDVGAPNLTMSSVDATCFGGSDGEASVSATGGVEPYTYQWDDDATQTADTAINLSAGTYNVIVTDADNCSASASVQIEEPNELVGIISSSSDASCTGICDGEATVSTNGGTIPYDYLWSDGQTTQTATALCEGTHDVTITDDNGCVTMASVTIEAPESMTVTATGTDATCGYDDGSVTASVSGGTAPYSYLWDDDFAQTSSTAFGLAPGTYSVTVTDANGCQASASATIDQDNSIEVSISASKDITCHGGSDGYATVSVSNGTSPYSYQWDDEDEQTTTTAVGLNAGFYMVTVTDANGCIGTASVELSEPDEALVINTSTEGESCDGCEDGEATAEVSGGIPPYTYQWSNGQTTETATGLASGSYTVTITDSNGCKETVEVYVDDLTSVDEMDTELDISIFPNPVQSVLNIELRFDNVQNFTIKLYDMSGRLILGNQYSQIDYLYEEIDMTNYSPGVYFIHIQSNEIMNKTYKVVSSK